MWIAGRLRRIGWPHLLLGGFVLAALGLIVAIRLVAASPNGGDLCRDYLDARRILAGQDAYAPFTACGDLHHSPHPPLSLLLLVPVALLPIGLAAALLDILMLAALALALALLWDELRPVVPPRLLALALGALLVWPPLLDTWLEAQIGPLLLLVLVLAWRARRQQRPMLAGAWLAVATLLRLYPALLFVYPLLRREWRVAAGGAIAGLGLTLATLPFIGPAGYLAYITREAPGSSAEWINDAHNVSLRGWLGMLFNGSNTIAPVLHAPGIITPLYLLLAALCVGFLLWQGWGARGAPIGSEADDLAWLGFIPGMILLSPLAWPHYSDILLLPLAVALPALYRRSGSTRARWADRALLGGYALFYLNALGLQLLYPLPRLLAWPAGVLVFALPCYALLLCGYGLWEAQAGAAVVPNKARVQPTVALTRGTP